MSNSIDSSALLSQLRVMADKAGIPATKEEVGASQPEFTSILKESIQSVNDRNQVAGRLARSFELGEPGVELSQVTIEMQKARIAFETLSQVRNKVISAYQEIMNMPI